MEYSDETRLILEAEIANLNEWLGAVLSPEAPMRHPAYDKACEHELELRVHAEGIMPIALIEAGRPSEPAEILAYRKAIFQPITMTEWEKARNVVMRVFQPGGFQIRFPNDFPPGIDEKNDLQQYTEDDFDLYYTLLNFQKDVMVQATLADPNGIVGIISEPSEEGELKAPMPYVFRSENVLWKRKDLVIALSGEKSIIKVGNSKRKEGFVGYVWTKEATYKFTQIGEKKELKFTIDELDRHDLGYIPVRTLGGVVKSEDAVTYYSSFFAGVVPHWNKAITIGSDFDGFIYRHLNPTLVRASMPCPTCRGAGKYQTDGEFLNCHDCAGTGYRGLNTKKSGSPYQDITFDLELLAKTNTKPSELMAYVSPPVANFREVREEINLHIDRGFGALNMEVVSRVGASQSGVAKAMDRQDLNGFLSECSTHFFDQLDWLYYVIGEIRYRPFLGDRWVELLPSITPPVKFDYVTTDSMLAEMQSAKLAETHPAIIKAMNISAAHKFLGDRTIEAQMVQAQIQLDPYDGMSEDSILSLNASGVLEKTDLYLHANIAVLLQEAVEANPDFLNLDSNEQRAVMTEIVAEKLGGQAISTTNKLRETVGGIDGILRIAEQVTLGIIDDASAIGILTDIYNFPQERASQIVAGFGRNPAPAPAPKPAPAPPVE